MTERALQVLGLPLRVAASCGAVVRGIGWTTLLAWRLVSASPRVARPELIRNLWRVGAESLPLALSTAITTGLMMVLQTTAYIRAFGVAGIMGWATGYATLREFVPLTVGIIYSGRVGASQASEIASLKAGEQLDALDALGVDLFATLLTPRFLAMAVSLVLVTGLCDLAALGAASLFSFLLVDVPPPSFFQGLAGALTAADALEGFEKALAYGTALGLTAIAVGLAAQGGAQAVGRAARQAVVSSMVAILLLDALLTGHQ